MELTDQERQAAQQIASQGATLEHDTVEVSGRESDSPYVATARGREGTAYVATREAIEAQRADYYEATGDPWHAHPVTHEEVMVRMTTAEEEAYLEREGGQ